MKKTLIIFLLILLIFPLINAADIQPAKPNVYYFYSTGCAHCKNVADSGILENITDIANLQKFDTLISQENRNKFTYYNDLFNLPTSQRGVPFLIIEKQGNYSYLQGNIPIISTLRNSIINFQPMETYNQNNEQITLGAIIISAVIDSINPCAFGVLLFLMVGLLSMGSSKRALKAGLVYTFVVFLVYFLVGLGIIHIFASITPIIHYVLIIAAILVFIGGLIEIKDFFWYGKGISLKIPSGIKPILERIIHKGTLPAIILLGALVALVELPCTGGIYLAILGLMSVSTLGIGYLIFYNLIFVLPLIIITFLIYHGTKIQTIQQWTENNKRFMRLAAGIIMILLAIYLYTRI